MRPRTCINIDYYNGRQARILGRLSHHERAKTLDLIETGALKMRRHICNAQCPSEQLCKYYARYGNK